ncbi:MAG: LysR family transcriptional regulator [Hyphomicrobium sp.]
MYKTRPHTVPYFEHPILRSDSNIQWDDLRVFLHLSRAQSFRSTAESLGTSANTIRGHIGRLEDSTGCKLFVRHATGVRLTVEGEGLVEIATRMDVLAVQAGRQLQRTHPGESGRVRISVTEGLGTFWLIPQLAKFQRAHPLILLEVNCSFRTADVVGAETDIAIQLTEPTAPNLIAMKVAYMHVVPYASVAYLRTFGEPKSLADVKNHKIIEQLSPQLDTSAVDRLFPDKAREGFVSIATNTSTAHLWAVAAGAGIGMLPTYISHLGFGLRPLDLSLVVSHDIWVCYDATSKKCRRIKLVLNFIKQCFDNDAFPWFGSKFVHPRDFPPIDPSPEYDGHLLRLFGGL